MINSDQLNELAAALSAAQARYPTVDKTKTGKISGQGKGGNDYSYTYSYADLTDVIEAAKPVNEEFGLSVSQLPGYDGDNDVLTTILLHSSGQYLGETMRLRLGKTDAQGQGSALSYAKRYAYCAVLGIVADSDDDGAHATKTAPQQPKQQYQKQQQRPQVVKQTQARKVDAETGEVTEEPLSKLLSALDKSATKQLEEQMEAAHYPPIANLPKAAERQVRRWIEEINKQTDKEKPF